LAACVTLGPNYERPQMKLPEAYSGAPEAGPIPDDWWTLFGDHELDSLEKEALTANQDLLAATARVEEARALAGIARADRFPEVWADASASRSKISAKSQFFPLTGVPLELTRLHAAASLSYEIDFWGRLRRLSEAARAQLLATAEGQRAVRLAVTSDVAGAYFDLRSLDAQLAVARETVSTRNDTVRLQRLRYDAGSISELDLSQAEAQLAAAEASVPALEQRRTATAQRLNVLLGRFGGAVETTGGVGRVEIPRVPAGLPSELLLRRPDVVAAEQQLVAANARIGAARAGYFPSISLTGTAGSESKELADLFGSGAGIWAAAAGLVQPIFQGNRVKHEVVAARARREQALTAYLKAAQTAFADVETALAARRTSAEERAALTRQLDALTRARRLASLRYDAGDASYLDLLEAERARFQAELALIASRRSEIDAALTLFRALGGGWQPAGEPQETERQ